MAREVSLLVPEFRTKLQELLDACKARGVNMSPYFTLRTPQEQGSEWRQGRSIADAELKALALENAKAPFLAACIRNNQPKETNKVTNAIPGYSWHQWGEACDCCWIDFNNKVNWSTTQVINGVNGYQVYAEEAKKMGLTPGGYWTNLKDWPHVQLRPDASPASLGVIAIDAEMKKRFGS